MKIATGGKVSLVLCFSILLLLCALNQPVTYAAGYPYGDYYNNNLTNTTAGNTQGPSISGKGDKVVFWSDQDLISTNPDLNPEVFLWTSPSAITQITSNAFNTLALLPLSSINFAGDKIAYLRYDNLARAYIVLWSNNTPTDKVFVPNGGGGGKSVTGLKISGNGDKIIYRTDGRSRRASDSVYLTADPLHFELYLWDNTATTVTQITTTTGNPTSPEANYSINYDGNLVAFSTKENTTSAFSGKNPDGNTELYLWNKDTGTTTQIASSKGGTGSFEPAITSYTKSLSTTTTTTLIKIAFCSDRDLVGKNPDTNPEIFLWTYTGSYAANNTNALTQITSTSVSGGACRNPQISRDGKFVTFTSNVDIVSGGISLLTGGTSAIFVWNSSGTITQVNTLGDSPVISSYTGLYESDTVQYGPRIAYFSTADGSEVIFLATSTIPVPATSRWGLVILILLLITLAVFVLKRRKKSAGGTV